MIATFGWHGPTEASTPTNIDSTCTRYYTSGMMIESIPTTNESKKQRRDRISKEKMLASHTVFNQVDTHHKKIIQICNPKYRLYTHRR